MRARARCVALLFGVGSMISSVANGALAGAADQRGLTHVAETPGSGVAPTEPVVALTFDDGPSPVWTLAMASVLERYGVRGTFFALGSEVARFPAVTEELAARGHTVENHTWSHPDLTGLSASGFASQVDSTTQVIESVTGQRVDCMRPPEGASNSTVRARAAERGLSTVLWSIDTRDFTRPGAGAIASTVLRQLHPGAIVLLHDGGGNRQQTLDALPAVIEGILARGYRIVPICGTAPRRPDPARPALDRNGDRAADLVVYRQNGAAMTWYWQTSGGGETVNWGDSRTDIATPGDFDGDGITDVAVWRRSSPARFWVALSTGGHAVVPWGEPATDFPHGVGDWDGDGRDDLAVIRLSLPDGPLRWFIRMGSGAMSAVPFGRTGDAPAPADYDGDGRLDFAVYRRGPTHLVLHVLGSASGYWTRAWGNPGTDVPALGDFDGDGIDDPAVIRNDAGTLKWFIHGSAGRDLVVPWGRLGDVPVAEDYDADGATDIAVWRSGGAGEYHIRRSTDGGLSFFTFGRTGDRPPVVISLPPS